MQELKLQKEKELVPALEQYQDQTAFAMEIIDDVVLKKFLTHLDKMEVVPLNQDLVANNYARQVRLFKINKMVYSKNEDSTFKMASVLNAVAARESSVFIMVDSNGDKVDFYMGIRTINQENNTKTTYDTLHQAMKGHFPGIQTENMTTDEISELMDRMDTDALSLVTGIASFKHEGVQENDKFIQGLEKLATTMQGHKFSGIILADPFIKEDIQNIKKQYEFLYSQLSPLSTTQITYGTNDSHTHTETDTEGSSEGKTNTTNESTTDTTGTSESTNTSKGTSSPDMVSKVLGAGATVMSGIGAVGVAAGAGAAGTAGAAGVAAAPILGVGIAVGVAVSLLQSTKTESSGESTSTNQSSGMTTGTSVADSYTTNMSKSIAAGLSRGSSQSIQLTNENKMLTNYLKQIDAQLDRIEEGESVGMWNTAAYFTSDHIHTSSIAAATYKSLMQGEDTGLEVSSITTWNSNDSEHQKLVPYYKNFMHPFFVYQKQGIELPILPTSLVSGKELAIQLSLPRKSVNGFPVLEHAEFAPEIISHSSENDQKVNLGFIHHLGQKTATPVRLNLESLSMHTLITGSTGSGKSNAIYELLSELEIKGINFLVIEPAKGEYKHIFGHLKNVRVYGTNPKITPMIKINPFKFPSDTHVLEHVDRLVEIFNVCWPMYAAMPAILKESILLAYSTSGWDLTQSEHSNESSPVYPSFKDVLISLEEVIENSAYEGETKGNYIGSLVTRVKSLTNGINGQIFSGEEIDNTILFDSNVIVDLSRVGSSETKSLLMGILVMRLNEHRMAHATELNSPLKHVTVLEEAHNLLKRTSTEQSSEGSNMLGKSVEMLSNAIAEMRTYGEGFIIVDQSPSMLDMSAIRNTNTKIILRLPEEEDRQLVGRSAALKDDQIVELAKLPRGVAAIYQNDWLETVLCQVNKFSGEEQKYQTNEQVKDESKQKYILLKFLMQNRVKSNHVFSEVELLEAIDQMNLRSTSKHELNQFVYNQSYFEKISNREFQEIIMHIIRDIVDDEVIEKELQSRNSLSQKVKALKTRVDQVLPDLSEKEQIVLLDSLFGSQCAKDKQLINEFQDWRKIVEGGSVF